MLEQNVQNTRRGRKDRYRRIGYGISIAVTNRSLDHSLFTRSISLSIRLIPAYRP